MRERTSAKNGLFLMELILVILIFSICSAICLQMFAYARLTARQAEDLSQATLIASSAAECYKATDGNIAEVAEILSGTATGNIITVTYGDEIYKLELFENENTAEIAISKVGNDGNIYTLNVHNYGGDAHE